MEKAKPHLGSLRWMWAASGSRLFGRGGIEYLRVDSLDRLEVERLLTLGELDAVQVDCGGGIAEWVGPPEARRLWLAVEPDLVDVQGWRPASGSAWHAAVQGPTSGDPPKATTRSCSPTSNSDEPPRSLMIGCWRDWPGPPDVLVSRCGSRSTPRHQPTWAR